MPGDHRCLQARICPLRGSRGTGTVHGATLRRCEGARPRALLVPRYSRVRRPSPRRQLARRWALRSRSRAATAGSAAAAASRMIRNTGAVRESAPRQNSTSCATIRVGLGLGLLAHEPRDRRRGLLAGRGEVLQASPADHSRPPPPATNSSTPAPACTPHTTPLSSHGRPKSRNPESSGTDLADPRPMRERSDQRRCLVCG